MNAECADKRVRLGWGSGIKGKGKPPPINADKNAGFVEGWGSGYGTGLGRIVKLVTGLRGLVDISIILTGREAILFSFRQGVQKLQLGCWLAISVTGVLQAQSSCT